MRLGIASRWASSAQIGPSRLGIPCHHQTHQISQVWLLAPHEGPVFAHGCHPLVGSLIEVLTNIILKVVPSEEGKSIRETPTLGPGGENGKARGRGHPPKGHHTCKNQFSSAPVREAMTQGGPKRPNPRESNRRRHRADPQAGLLPLGRRRQLGVLAEGPGVA